MGMKSENEIKNEFHNTSMDKPLSFNNDISILILYHESEQHCIEDIQKELETKRFLLIEDYAKIMFYDKKIKLVNKYDYIVVVISKYFLGDLNLLSVLKLNYKIREKNRKILPLIVDYNLYEPEARAEVLKYLQDRMEYFEVRFCDNYCEKSMASTLKKMRQIYVMLIDFLEFAVNRDRKSGLSCAERILSYIYYDRHNYTTNKETIIIKQAIEGYDKSHKDDFSIDIYNKNRVSNEPRQLLINKKEKVFISYSWTPESNRIWVQKLVHRLESDGIQVIVDFKDLKLGHDKYAFMEKIVNDNTIKKVLIICNKTYKEKANERVGGVGEEAAIITPQIYGNISQEKFIPIVNEYDDNDKPFLPDYLESRMYVDLTDFEIGYMKLLHNIVGIEEVVDN